jgi:hypothetical protein
MKTFKKLAQAKQHQSSKSIGYQHLAGIPL